MMREEAGFNSNGFTGAEDGRMNNLQQSDWYVQMSSVFQNLT